MKHQQIVCLVILCLVAHKVSAFEVARQLYDKNTEEEEEDFIEHGRYKDAPAPGLAEPGTKDDDVVDLESATTGFATDLATMRSGPNKLELQSLDGTFEQEETKTYERVVSEGSSIRISCPHMSGGSRHRNLASPTSFASGTVAPVQQQSDNNNNKGGQKQFAPSRQQQQQQKRPTPESDPDSGASNVKWFRNHVPLMNINHNQERQRQWLFAAASSLSSPTTYDLNDEPQQAPVQQRDVAGGGLEPGENVNELAGARKRTNMPSAVAPAAPAADYSSWRVNDLGELVINNVSKYLAGEYTCLSEGRMSEILLDVLVDVSSGVNRLQGGDVAKLENETLLNNNNNDSISYGKGRNEPIEMDIELESKTDNNPLVDNNPSLGSGANSIITNPMGGDEDVLSPIAVSGVVGAGQRGVDRERGPSTTLALARRLANGGDGNGLVSTTSAPATTNSNKINVFGRLPSRRQSRSRVRRHPVHVVKSQALQFADLKQVPGFLYTKQQLYCPVTGQTGFHFDHISPLLNSFCPASRPIQSSNSHLLIKCYRLARRLVARLMLAAGAGQSFCSSSIFDLIWFKDGKQLEFDTNGQAEEGSQGTNVKLVISRSQLHETEQAASAGLANQSNWLICPPDGRTLEIEGLRKESAGRYQCALRLDMEKLKKIIKRLRELNEPSKPLKWPHFHDNDISLVVAQRDLHPGGSQIRTNDVSDLPRTNPSLRGSSREVTNRGSGGKDEGAGPMAERIVRLESILNGQLSSEQSLDHIERLLEWFQPASNPLLTVQTFSLLVSERPANSCDLWSTIQEAESAYTRRKLADFKRLKRSSVAADNGPITLESQSGDEEGSLDSIGADGANHQGIGATSSNYDKDDFTLNESHLMQPVGHDLKPNKMEQERVSNSGHNLLMNNAISSSGSAGTAAEQQLQIGTNHQQTKSRSESLFDYANERNLRPLLRGQSRPIVTDYGNFDAVPTTRLGRALRPSDPSDDMGGFVPEGGRGGNEYMNGTTKDLITQRGYISESQTSPSTSQSFGRGSETPEGPMPMLESSSDEYHQEGIGSDGSEFLIDDSSQSSSSKDGGNNNSPSRISAASTDNLEGSDQLDFATSDDSQGHSATGESRRVSIAPGYKLRQLGRYSERDSSNSLPQLNSQSIEPANQSNGFTTLRAPNDQSIAALENVVSFGGGSPKKSIDVFAPHSQTGLQADKMQGLIDEPSVHDDRFDESLMWKASQYLYMHMRAIASSSMFGVELTVEWSNEKANGSSSIDVLDGKAIPEILSQSTQSSFSHSQSHGQTRDAIPFATINVMSGQSLQLQCTAQALGRLPEIKWYKRIAAIPPGLGGLASSIVRRVGQDLYWPLTDLDLLNDHNQFSPKTRSFVCSQTTAIYDNLTNQTFTVVNNLQLGQYNDRSESIGTKMNPLNMDEYNLYACIVDADIRHNYATLGVHHRESTNKLPLEIRKRLKARAVSSDLRPMKQISSARMRNINSEVTNKISEFSLYRENLLQFPLRSYWVPIKNRSNSDGQQSMLKTSTSLTPTLLSTLIMIVFSSLLALVYLTLKTYRALMLNQPDEDSCDGSLQQEPLSQMSNRVFGPSQNSGLPQRYLCQCMQTQSITDEEFNDGIYDRDELNQVLFGNHNNNVHDHCICQNEPLADIPSEVSHFDYNQPLRANWCLQESKSSAGEGQVISCTVNLIDNPLND